MKTGNTHAPALRRTADDEEDAPWMPGSASRWWLHQSLEAPRHSLRERGSNLIIRRGPTRDALLNLAADRAPKPYIGHIEGGVIPKPQITAKPNQRRRLTIGSGHDSQQN